MEQNDGMERNSEYAQLQLTCVTGTAQPQHVYEQVGIAYMLLCPSMICS